MDQGREFLGEFQILCEQNLIDYQTTSHDHMKMNRLHKKVVQMVKWGSQKKGRLKYWNLNSHGWPWDINLNKLHFHHFPFFCFCGRNVDLPTTT